MSKIILALVLSYMGIVMSITCAVVYIVDDRLIEVLKSTSLIVFMIYLVAFVFVLAAHLMSKGLEELEL